MMTDKQNKTPYILVPSFRSFMVSAIDGKRTYYDTLAEAVTAALKEMEQQMEMKNDARTKRS